MKKLLTAVFLAAGIIGAVIELVTGFLIDNTRTKLGKALDESKKKSKSLQSELKQVEKLLKLDPKNVELLSQKQKILTEQVEETKKRHIRVSFSWVKGHSGNAWNEYADSMCVFISNQLAAGGPSTAQTENRALKLA